MTELIAILVLAVVITWTLRARDGFAGACQGWPTNKPDEVRLCRELDALRQHAAHY